MVSAEQLREWALAFPETEEQPHFEKTSFRVRKKIFCTLHMQEGRAVLKLSPEDQDVFSAHPGGAIGPVSGGWGKQGWTAVDLAQVDPRILQDALRVAYRTVAPAKLARGFFD